MAPDAGILVYYPANGFFSDINPSKRAARHERRLHCRGPLLCFFPFEPPLFDGVEAKDFKAMFVVVPNDWIVREQNRFDHGKKET